MLRFRASRFTLSNINLFEGLKNDSARGGSALAKQL